VYVSQKRVTVTVRGNKYISSVEGGGMTALRGTPFVPIRPSTFVPAAKTPNKSSYGVMLVPVTCVSSPVYY